MKRILVAVDGSDASKRAVQLAAEFARFQGAKVVAAHVVQPLFVPPEPYGFNSGSLEAANREYGQQLASEAAAAVKELGAEAEALVLTGSPPEMLLEVSQAEDVALVVVGSSGRGAFSRAMLGSVSDRIVHHCQKPVLVVR
jgi:nucleotide-binding universal stress UspA family protein